MLLDKHGLESVAIAVRHCNAYVYEACRSLVRIPVPDLPVGSTEDFLCRAVVDDETCFLGVSI